MVISEEILADYPNLPSVSPIGVELDWAWLAGHKSEWGVHPKPSARGLTMMYIAVGSYADVPEHSKHRSMAARGADIAFFVDSAFPACSTFLRCTSQSS